MPNSLALPDVLDEAEQQLTEDHSALQRFTEYVAKISAGPTASISPETASRAVALLHEALKATTWRLVLPYAYALEDGRLYCTWDNEKYHLEVIFSDVNDAEWYGSDGTFTGAWVETARPETLPRQAVIFFGLFTA